MGRRLMGSRFNGASFDGTLFNGTSFCCVCRLGSLSKEHGTKTDTKKEEKEESAPDSNENDGKYYI